MKGKKFFFFLNDLHKDFEADYVLANPPFNDSGIVRNLFKNDARWKVLGRKI